MADVPDLRLVPNCCGGMSLVYEGRAYKLKRAGRQKYWRCSKDKEGCGGAIWTNLDVTTVIKRYDRIKSCQRSAEETKPILAIYDEEATLRPPRRVRAAMYGHRAKRFPKLPNHRRDLQIPSASRHILVFATGTNIRLLAACRTWGMDGTFKIVPQWYQQLFTIHAFAAAKLVPAVCCLCTDKDIGTYGFKSQALISRAAALEDKEGCGGAIWTNLDVTSVIMRNDPIESCQKRSAEETKPIPAIYDEEASAASAEPSTSALLMGKVHDVQPLGNAIPETA
ncbi:hypothetical protein T08_12659 [Trichinella sp. T8]|nr:hypothetical protein T08_12659 [Trichinella sp. T8]